MVPALREDSYQIRMLNSRHEERRITGCCGIVEAPNPIWGLQNNHPQEERLQLRPGNAHKSVN